MPSGIYKRISGVNCGWGKGIPASKETRKKVSDALKGKKQSPEAIRNRFNSRKGYTHSKKTRQKISEALKGKYGGEKSSNWKGGISSKNQRIRSGIEFRLWRESIFARDNYTCQRCGQIGGKLSPHHIFNFSTYLDLRFAIDNGITFCKECHEEFHRRYLKKNNTREQVEEFLN